MSKKWEDKCEEALEDNILEYQRLIYDEFNRALDKVVGSETAVRYEDNMEAIIDEYADGVPHDKLMELKKRYKDGWHTRVREALVEILENEWSLRVSNP